MPPGFLPLSRLAPGNLDPRALPEPQRSGRRYRARVRRRHGNRESPVSRERWVGVREEVHGGCLEWGRGEEGASPRVAAGAGAGGAWASAAAASGFASAPSFIERLPPGGQPRRFPRVPQGFGPEGEHRRPEVTGARPAGPPGTRGAAATLCLLFFRPSFV